MTTYTDPTTVNVAHKKRVSVEFGLAALNNPTAIAEGITDAPIVRGGWIPYGMDHYDDGATGFIYNYDDDGAVSTITSPTLIQGWEYMLVFNALEMSAAITSFKIQGYRVQGSTYVDLKSFATADWNPSITTSNQTVIDGDCTFLYPMTPNKRTQRHEGGLYFSSSGLDAGAFIWDEMTPPTTANVTYSRIRLVFASSGSTIGGHVRMYKRGFSTL